jgi:hypothetical protein
MATILWYANKKKYKLIKYYYGQFLWLCVVIPQQLNNIYLMEAFREKA